MYIFLLSRLLTGALPHAVMDGAEFQADCGLWIG